MDRLILVEGLPGSGKTTFAKKLFQNLSGSAQDVHLYVEGDLHPTDMAWCACLTAQEYQSICREYPEYVGSFEQNKEEWDGNIILAYTKIEGLKQELVCYFEQKEIYDGHVGKERFCALQKGRWKEFGLKAAGITIFECAFLQNMVNELLLFAGMGEESIFRYMSELVSFVLRLKPLVIYLDMNAETAINRAAEERVDSAGIRVWEQRVSEYIAASPYGKANGLSGVSGLYRYFETRRQLELRLLERLPVGSCRARMVPEHQHEQEELLLQKIKRQLETECAV